MSAHMSASADYRTARAELAAAERQLRAAAERVAALRGALPPGPEVDPGTPLTMAGGKPVTLGGLFGPHRSLVTYGLRFDEGWERPCPASAMWVDGLDALTPHLAERAGVAVLAPASPGQLAAVVARRGWSWVPVVSSQPSDLVDRLGLRAGAGAGAGTGSGGLMSAVTVFHWGDDGRVRLHWQATEGAPTPTPAGGATDAGSLDFLCAAWGLLDLLPEGRAAWRPTRQDRPLPRR
ncbi:Predicted dithiol-disulfide oxidoreductase, DUF899 family [Streptoalloteichus hindustanus]|uniref:Predicted dithiol-disulfide oxidoreductase, DUF899 family n=2 Tax=Streptoalloteichus hindustanus TaxID=2017 RepID=A0A1M5HD61_STRHI|nr:Predicted dithiol-disulfide oxidoreductase, DUF899 family [Streptoalloteichus hindustanus]